MRRIVAAALAALVAASMVALAPGSALPAGAAGRDPVVLVAGTLSPGWVLDPLAARLESAGYDTHIFVLPSAGLDDIRQTARALDDYADQVRAATGASRLDMVGHSQGGLAIRQYVKFEGGASEVDSAISLGTPHYGTVVAGICTFLPACEQMFVGSSFLADLNAGDDTVGSVRYTNLYTVYDELVRPVANATMRDGATNVLVQSQCPLRVVEHVGLALDGTVADGIKDALAGNPISLNCWAL